MQTTTVRTALFAAALLAGGHLQATVIFNSNSTAADPNQYNTSTSASSPNVIISPNTAWAAALPGSNWISFENTGDPSSQGFQTVPNGTVVSFFQNFYLNTAGATVNGTISVLADDSTSVILNGTTLVPEASQVGNSYSTCSDTAPNCVAVETLVLPSADLKVGKNVLEFDVAQRAGSSFGLDYSGTAGVPEPGTVGLMGLGMLAVGILGRKFNLAK